MRKGVSLNQYHLLGIKSLYLLENEFWLNQVSFFQSKLCWITLGVNVPGQIASIVLLHVTAKKTFSGMAVVMIYS